MAALNARDVCRSANPALLQELLAALRPGVLRQLDLLVDDDLPAAPVEALPRFAPHLTSLGLDACSLPTQLPAALRQLPQLVSLRISAWDLAEAFAAVPELSALTSLVLESYEYNLPDCRPLAVLQQLQRLHLLRRDANYEYGYVNKPLLLPAPANFPCLEVLEAHPLTECQVGCCMPKPVGA